MQNQAYSIFIPRLTKLVPVERIYICHYEIEEVLIKELTIIIAQYSKMMPSEAKPLVSMVLSDYPDYRFNIFSLPEIKRALHYGSMFLYRVCKEDSMIYKSPESTVELTSGMTGKSILKKAKRNFDREWKKAADFRQGYTFYFEAGNYAFAAFMLHQMVELTYRGVELLVIGKEKASHAIRNHQKLMLGCVTDLGLLFNEADEQEQALLLLLDSAYRSVRYELDYEIDREQLLLLLAKADQAAQIVGDLYERIVGEFTTEVESEEGESRPLASPKPFSSSEPFSSSRGNREIPCSGKAQEISPAVEMTNTLVSKICSLAPVLQIYELGRRGNFEIRTGSIQLDDTFVNQIHYDLLVIVEGACLPEYFNLQGQINQDLEMEDKVVLLVHSMKSVQEARAAGNRFFHERIAKGILLYRAKDRHIDLGISAFEEETASREEGLHIQERLRKAEILMVSAADAGGDDGGVVRIFLMSQATVQACLAYIELQIGYRPNQLSLKQLFRICEMIAPLIDEIFPVRREQDRQLFNWLVDADRNLRYKTGMHIPTIDQCLLQRRCVAWIEAVQGI